jgi:hypothetical protein
MTPAEVIRKLCPPAALEHATWAQKKAMLRVVKRQRPDSIKSIGHAAGDDYMYVQTTHMYIGIEKDGYAHT